MATVAVSIADEMAESSQWDDTPPPKFEEQELDILAFELWQRANLAPLDDELTEEEAHRGHASFL